MSSCLSLLGRPALWRMDDLALGEGQAKEAIFAAGIDDSMVGHARFGLDDLSNREKGKLVHLSSLQKELNAFYGPPR